MARVRNKNGREFLEFISLKEKGLDRYSPVAGSIAVLKHGGNYLLCYNIWRKQWEIPAGRREGDETPRECAIRELYEETVQQVTELEFKGLMKVKDLSGGIIKYNPVYFTKISERQPFKENEETSGILLWDKKKEIGDIDAVDLQILNYI
ncbi:NUDIX domain-containing protein [Halobacillus shinanisalinarum]|uniref:NUDIX domain-containing protein n=1 Tax=Halobacillus shinanisalinarum TaxID=2932258 RepID=A0ABY4H3K2_9BACI|nr:NUDIX domain-containing protein [Halobacillus shinanisalinarum]UOQ95003.1 NUDIX domain-containing protein [Halobacillus shinanisalinarum]